MSPLRGYGLVLRTWDVGLKPDAIECHRSAVGRGMSRLLSRGATEFDQPWVSTQGFAGLNLFPSRGATTVGRAVVHLSPLRGYGLVLRT
jgi:hypothetical protein